MHTLSIGILDTFQLTQLHKAHHLQSTQPNSKFNPEQSWLNTNQADPINALKHAQGGPKMIPVALIFTIFTESDWMKIKFHFKTS